MTTLSPIANPTALIPRPVETPPATPMQATDGALARPAAVVSLGAVSTDVFSQTYSRQGQLPGQDVVRTWESDSQDALSQAINTHFNAQSTASRFKGLGATLMEQFAKGNTDISQSVLYASADKAQTPGAIGIGQALLHSKADNLVSLSIQTASGKTVTFSLSSQDNGLGVQATVDGGPLSADELKAVGQLGTAFQSAIDGLTGVPPKLDLSNLTQFDTRVLASVDLNAKLKTPQGEDVSLAFHADSQSRTTRMNGPAGEIDLAVDLKNSAIQGNAQQQAKALKSYLAQFDQAQQRGNANADLMAMFKEAFSAMNSHYPASAAAPLTNHPTDQNLLTGLADFKASIQQTAGRSNPMRPAEVDSFAYTLLQKTRVGGTSTLDRSVTQDQQSALSASFHTSLTGGKAPALSGNADSQNYRYVQVQDTASSTASLAYKNGALTGASVTQQASQNTHTQQYVMAKLVEETDVPKAGAITRDYVALLEQAAQASRASKAALQASTLNTALNTLHANVMLQGDPSALVR